MTPEERELRRALEARSGEPSPQFQARLTAALDEGKPSSGLMQATAIVAVIAITLGTVGALLLSRNARNIALREGSVSGTRLSSPTPNPNPVDRIPMPTTAQLSVPSSNVVWALVANSALFRSTDKGNAWEQRSLPAAIGGGGLPEVSFVDDRLGWLLHPAVAASQCSGQGAEIWRTTDGAGTWQRVAYLDQQNPGLGFGQCKGSLSFVDATHGFVAAGDGNFSPTIYRTADGGKTWSGSTLPDPPDFKTSAGGSALRAGLVNRFGSTLYVQARGQQAGDIPDRQYMFRSTDGGATWSWMTKVPPRPIVMVTESRWLQLLIPGQSMESINGGQQWHPYESDFNTDTPVGRPQIVFADSQVGYAEGRGALQQTVDGGLHWVRIATPGTATPIPTPPPTVSPARTNFNCDPDAVAPAKRAAPAVAYDPATKQVLYFGGTANAESGYCDTWVWTGSAWSHLHPAHHPSGRSFAYMAFDYGANRMLLYGGGDLRNDPPVFDAWSWDGNDWSLISDSRKPAFQNTGTAASGPNLGLFLLYSSGVLNADQQELIVTYRWTPTGWSKVEAAGPVGRIRPGFTYDPDIGKLLKFGGSHGSHGPDATDIWTFDGTTWTQLNPSGLRPAGGAGSMTHDAIHKQVVWLGADGTWTFEKDAWTQRASVAQSPPYGGWQGTMVFDPVHGQVLFTGTLLGDGSFGGTYVWDGAKWTAY
jgi:photosystem II stability/assembly factor-like uncharacterized protein